jgi:hypothetical protein
MISRTSKAARVTWSLAYFFVSLAGILAFFTPAQIVDRVLVEASVYLWAGFLSVGGLLSLGGKLRNTWAGEIIGLPLLAAANCVFGALIWFASSTAAALAIGSMFFGVATAFVARWIELKKLAKENQGVNNAAG